MATYACSDLHGCKALFQKIRKFLKSDDIVYFLGDAADRGTHGWEIIKEIATDSRFIPIKGNHEDMLISAAESYFPDERPGRGYSLLVNNGGGNTFYDMTNDPWNREWINHIKKYPTHIEYINKNNELVLLSHAGYTPWFDERDGSTIMPTDSDLIWSREHFWDDWDEENFGKTIVVHGHTPIPYMAEYLRTPERDDIEKPFWYCNNHKVCIDSAAFATDICFLLNLDDWSYHTFQVHEDE